MLYASFFVRPRSLIMALCLLCGAELAAAEGGALFVPKRAAGESQEQPSISGDGMRITYLSHVNGRQQSQDAVMLFDRRTGELTELTVGLKGYFYAPMIARDGGAILFRTIPREINAPEALFVYDVGARALQPVVIPSSLGLPAAVHVVDSAISRSGRYLVARVNWSVDDGETETFFERMVWIDRTLHQARVLVLPGTASTDLWLTLLGATSDQEYFAMQYTDPAIDSNAAVTLAARFDDPTLTPVNGSSPIRALESLVVRADRGTGGTLAIQPFSAIGEIVSAGGGAWTRTLLGRLTFDSRSLSVDQRYLAFTWSAPFRSEQVSSTVQDTHFQEVLGTGGRIGLVDLESGSIFDFDGPRTDAAQGYWASPAIDAAGQTIVASETRPDGALELRVIDRQAFQPVACTFHGRCFQSAASRGAPRVIREYEYRVADPYVLLPIRSGVLAEIEVQYLESLDPGYVSEEKSCPEFTTARTRTAVVTRKRVRSNVVRLPRPQYLCQQYADGNDRYRVRFRTLRQGGAKPTAWSLWTEFLGTFYFNPV